MSSRARREPGVDVAKNPFKMPSDAEVFQLRDEERRRKKAERDVMRRLKVRLVVVANP